MPLSRRIVPDAVARPACYFDADGDGTLMYATGVQDTGGLDDLHAYTGQLGVIVCDAAEAGGANCPSNAADLLYRSGWIRVGLTGNVRDYSFVDALGRLLVETGLPGAACGVHGDSR